MKCLVFESYDNAVKWRSAHKYLNEAPMDLKQWFLIKFGNETPYPNNAGTIAFSDIQNLSGGRFVYDGEPIDGYLIHLYDHLYDSLVKNNLWDVACAVLSYPKIVTDCLEIEHLAI